MLEAVHIHIACISRSRSGPYAYGLSLSNPVGEVLFEHQGLLPGGTVAQASYLALLTGLEEAARLGARRITVYSDCDVLVSQMRGRSPVREEPLKTMHDRTWLLTARLKFHIILASPSRNPAALHLAESAMAATGVVSAPVPHPIRPVAPGNRKSGIQRSAGGIVYRRVGDTVHICLIAKGRVWALPKGRLNDGETFEQAAVREILEETGHLACIEARVQDIQYWFYWKENNTLYHKTVTFFLMALVDENHASRDMEADDVAWFSVDQACELLSYPNEREVLLLALEHLAGRL